MTAPDKTGPPIGEFVVRTALAISLTALAVDAMLPALQQIGGDLGVQRDNDAQLIISSLLLGLAFGQMIYGPISDSTGRKPPMYAGFALFILGCLLSAAATSFPMMLAGRFLQGLGAAAPRILAVALVRDRYEGRAMARIMSLIMGVFILVPAIAPAMGQGILLVAQWPAIFDVLLVLALVVLVWFAVRQRETLTPDRRVPFSVLYIGRAIRETCTHRASLGYTIAAGMIFGAFLGFLNSSQQIFQGQYGQGKLFPVYFAVLALSIGGASWVNAQLVVRFGMRRLSGLALVTLSGLSLAFFAVAWTVAGNPPLWALMAYLMTAFFCMGILFGNFNALAMDPLGHIAGVAASVIGSLTTFIMLLLGTMIGQAYDGTVLPLVGGFAALGIAAFAVMRWVERESGP